MPEYMVTFEIDTPEEIETPEDAARWVAGTLADGYADLAVYTVTNTTTGVAVNVDLSDR